MYVVTIKEVYGRDPVFAFAADVENLELLTAAIEEAIRLAVSIETEPQPPDETPQ